MKKTHRRTTFVLLTIVAVGPPAVGQIISWDASSGLLPFDASISSDQRFELSGDSSFVSMQDGFLNVSETDTGSGMSIGKSDIDPIAIGGDWSYQVELRMKSHQNSGFDIGCLAGVYDSGGRRLTLYFARDTVGFARAQGWQDDGIHSMDTTDGFHVYRVTKSDGLVRVFVDHSPDPVISLAYDEFEVIAVSSAIYLAQTSHPGVADFDVRRFIVNLSGADLGVPTVSEWGLIVLTLLGMTAATIMLARRRRVA